MKSIIIYSSRHHGSTKKLAGAIGKQYCVDLWDADTEQKIDLSDYDLIGFASGIDFGKFYPTVTEIAQTLPAGKHVYALFTCARDNGSYGDQIQEITAERNCSYLGKFGCRGYNTYGPWKLIGGMNKGHPSPAELEDALQFYSNLEKKIEKPGI